MKENLLDIAIREAVRHHTGQYRKSLKIPYVSHCFDVMKKLVFYEVTDPQQLAAAMLHDTIEDKVGDKVMTAEMIEALCGKKVADIVVELTRPESEGNSKQQKFEYLYSFFKKSKEALLIKFADRVCNVLDYRLVSRSRRYACAYALEAYPIYQAVLARIGRKDDLPKELQKDLNQIQLIVWELEQFDIFMPDQKEKAASIVINYRD